MSIQPYIINTAKRLVIVPAVPDGYIDNPPTSGVPGAKDFLLCDTLSTNTKSGTEPIYGQTSFSSLPGGQWLFTNTAGDASGTQYMYGPMTSSIINATIPANQDWVFSANCYLYMRAQVAGSGDTYLNFKIEINTSDGNTKTNIITFQTAQFDVGHLGSYINPAPGGSGDRVTTYNVLVQKPFKVASDIILSESLWLDISTSVRLHIQNGSSQNTTGYLKYTTPTTLQIPLIY